MEIGFYILSLFLTLGVLSLVGFLIYISVRFIRQTAHRHGKSTLSKYLALSAISVCLFCFGYLLFPDIFFGKNDVQQLLTEQSIRLNDDFNLIENRSSFAIGDYYRTFSIKISLSDKIRLIRQLKASSNYVNGLNDESTVLNIGNRYVGHKQLMSYETQDYFIVELMEPKGQGLVPLWRKIKIGKASNQLIFEEIDE